MSPLNPFDSTRLRPGALPFIFREGGSVAKFMDRLRGTGWWGQIIGPHGTGKSTLLRTLMPALRDAGREIVYVRFRGGKLVDSSAELQQSRWNARTQIIIDGYEQLGWLARLRWRWACRWRRCGLLVTAHCAVGLPTLYESHVDNELAQRIAARLLAADGNRESISPSDVTAALAARRGDLRAAFFDLYDIYEQRRRRAATQ